MKRMQLISWEILRIHPLTHSDSLVHIISFFNLFNLSHVVNLLKLLFYFFVSKIENKNYLSQIPYSYLDFILIDDCVAILHLQSIKFQFHLLVLYYFSLIKSQTSTFLGDLFRKLDLFFWVFFFFFGSLFRYTER